MSCYRALSAACVATLLAATAARADVMIGTTGLEANTLPFDTTITTITEYQELYPSADFAGPTAITALEFFDTYSSDGHHINTGTYVISLLTTSASALAATGSPLLDTTGATTFFSGQPGPQASDHSLTITGAATFNYDPSAGNLLLDITETSVTNCFQNSTACGAFDADSGLDFSYSDGTNTYTYAGGLVTDFIGTTTDSTTDSTPTPEPASIALLGAGLLGLFGARRRKR